VIIDDATERGSASRCVHYVFTRVWETLQLLLCCVLGVVVAIYLVVVGSYYVCMVLGGLTIGQLTASRRARDGVALGSNYVGHWWPSREHRERPIARRDNSRIHPIYQSKDGSGGLA